ncbi:hypothetical protein NEOLEDRAFT_1130592 [Neolentinus lepideus HHB14362 ss-1]|uniref:Uncharacterized protein n=1 Tax=Neolentinus lepideus HHB14362 ss-1 TaxID=1314782 RepID=A0A165U3J2_9AGAM|nr:hypothetical protein NEOLEDRAFT_1130592 [Neolentinus lepideus HHB14362 ss-1]
MFCYWTTRLRSCDNPILLEGARFHQSRHSTWLNLLRPRAVLTVDHIRKRHPTSLCSHAELFLHLHIYPVLVGLMSQCSHETVPTLKRAVTVIADVS